MPANKYRRKDGIRKSPSCNNHNKNGFRQESSIHAKRGGGQSLVRNRRFIKSQSIFPQITYKLGKKKQDNYTVEQKGNFIKSLTLT